MRITRAVLHQIDLPFREPFVISYASWESMPSLLLELHTDDGLVGWGEAVPDEVVTGETAAAAVRVLRDLLLPAVMGARASDLEDVHARMDRVIGANPSAKAAVDLACHDLLGRRADLPLHDLLGGCTEPEPTFPGVLSIAAPEAMAEAASAAIDAGYASIKAKVGQGDWRTDVARVRAVCEAVDGRVPVRVDVNQGWRTAATAIRAVRALEGVDLSWIEEPIAMGDVEGLAEVRRHSPVPVMADETCQDPAGLIRIVRHRAADLVNIKLMKTGGLYRAVQMAGIAEAAGLGVQLGSMVESSVASAAGYHLVAARSVIGSSELVGPLMFTRDPGDLRFELPHVVLPTGPGLGVTVDRDVLEDLTGRTWTVTAGGEG